MARGASTGTLVNQVSGERSAVYYSLSLAPPQSLQLTIVLPASVNRAFYRRRNLLRSRTPRAAASAREDGPRADEPDCFQRAFLEPVPSSSHTAGIGSPDPARKDHECAGANSSEGLAGAAEWPAYSLAGHSRSNSNRLVPDLTFPVPVVPLP
jgi:hypothetical protein